MAPPKIQKEKKNAANNNKLIPYQLNKHLQSAKDHTAQIDKIIIAFRFVCVCGLAVLHLFIYSEFWDNCAMRRAI